MNKYYIQLLIIIFIALALRFYNITYHSIWFDEAVSVHWARQTVARILEVGFTLVEDRLPPLYYLMLKGWTARFGFSETSIRALSALFGTLLVPVTAGIAARLFNRRVAVISALLVALNPFLIWYSQEARMYASAAFFGALSVWALLQICPPPERKAGNTAFFAILFTLSAIAGLYNHLYAGFLLPALGLWLVISYPRRRQLWLVFAIGGMIITLAFAPIALAIWRFSAEATPGDPLIGLTQRAWWLLQAFTVWKAPLTSPWHYIITAVILLYAMLAFLPNPLSTTNDQAPKNPKLLVALLLLAPFVIANILLARNHLAFFGERYFIVMVPWLVILVAVGADNVARWLKAGMDERGQRMTGDRRPGTKDEGRKTKDDRRPETNDEGRRTKDGHNSTTGKQYPSLRNLEPETRNLKPGTRKSLISYTPVLLLLVVSVIPIPGQWSISASKEAWRQSVAYLAQHAAEDHAILIHPDWVRFPFQYYFQGPGQTYAAFSTVTPDTDLDGPLQGVVGDHPVVWLIQSHIEAPDPARRVEQWLAARYPLVTELYPPGISLKGYAPGYQVTDLPGTATPVDIHFDNGLSLVGYEADSAVAARDEIFHPPSGWLHVTLYWTANRSMTEDVTPFVHLVGPEGVWGVSLKRANDALQLYPTSHWFDPSLRKQKVIRHDLDVNLNPATPAGTYQLVVGLPDQEKQYVLGEVNIY